MCKRNKGVASWNATAWVLESHGEVSCGGNQHEELGCLVCSFVSLKHGSDYSRIGQSSFCKFEEVLLQLLLLSGEFNCNLLSDK